MKKLRRAATYLAALILSLGLAASAQAMPINGSFSMDGGPGAGFTPTDALGNPTSLSTAVGIDFDPAGVGGTFDLSGVANGDYSGLTSGTTTTGTITDFVFNPLGGTINNFLTITDPDTLIVYSFDLQSVSIVLQTDSFLTLSATGIARATGFDDTQATWNFSGQSAGGQTFSWSASLISEGEPTKVPEPSAMMLLGFGLVGLATWARRREN